MKIFDFRLLTLRSPKFMHDYSVFIYGQMFDIRGWYEMYLRVHDGIGSSKVSVDLEDSSQFIVLTQRSFRWVVQGRFSLFLPLAFLSFSLWILVSSLAPFLWLSFFLTIHKCGYTVFISICLYLINFLIYLLSQIYVCISIYIYLYVHSLQTLTNIYTHIYTLHIYCIHTRNYLPPVSTTY